MHCRCSGEMWVCILRGLRTVRFVIRSYRCRIDRCPTRPARLASIGSMPPVCTSGSGPPTPRVVLCVERCGNAQRHWCWKINKNIETFLKKDELPDDQCMKLLLLKKETPCRPV